MEEKILDMLAEICEDDIVRENQEVELFESGLLDSLVFAELLFAIEENFNVIISPSEVDRSEFDTPRKIIDVIMARLK